MALFVFVALAFLGWAVAIFIFLVTRKRIRQLKKDGYTMAVALKKLAVAPRQQKRQMIRTANKHVKF